MKSKLRFLFIAPVLLAGFALSARATVTFSVAPSAVSNTYVGPITLQIAGLTNGETVVVQKFLDVSAKGVVEPGDWLVQQFILTDGQAGMVIGGVTNFNVPGDTDGTANGQITAALNFQNGDIGPDIIGGHLYVLSSPVGHFAPITNRFTVTNFPFAQKITGLVLRNGTAATVPNAAVLLFQSGRSVLAGTVADGSGAYTLMAPPGNYWITSFNSNYVGAFSSAAPVLALGAGQTITTNLTATPATTGISGSVVDVDNASQGLPGLTVTATSASGLLTVGFTDTNGNFNLPVTAGNWGIIVSHTALNVHGHLGLQDHTTAAAGATGVSIALPQATALIYGRVADTQGNPLTALDVNAEDNSLYEIDVYTDANGNYCLGALGLGDNDYWSVAANDDNQLTNYVFSEQTINGNLNAGQAALQNFTAILATNYITGSLTDNNGNPLPGVQIYDDALINDLYYNSENVGITDANGNYVLNVCNGTWDVWVDDLPADESNKSLPGVYGDGNYLDPAEQYPVIANNNSVVNFIATSTSDTFAFIFTTNNDAITITGITGHISPGGTVTIPGTFNGLPVTTIGDYAFLNQVNLTGVTIGTNITIIGDGAFQGCISLTSVAIPGGVATIGEDPFGSCSSLTAITVAIGNPVYDSVNGVLFGQNQTILMQYPDGLGGSYTIPGSVTSIGFGAFDTCENLASVTIPGSVTSIDDYAFNNCYSLNGIYFSGNAPGADSTIFSSDNNATVYYLPGTSGWSSPFGGVPAVMLNAPHPSGSLEVTITPAGAVNAGAQWQVDGGVSQPSGATVLGLAVGSHTVSFSAISGWATPANQPVTILANETATATATYVNLQPFVTVQPVSQIIAAGGSVTFSVTVGGPGPYRYAWYQNGASIPAATNSSYIINNAPLADSGGQFFCVISNAYGSITSSAVWLTVGAAPTITSQPANQALLSGGTATFNVAVSGTGPLTYQWQLDGTNLPGTIITTVAGNGGYGGDGGVATNATLSYPSGVAVDGAGNVFIADYGNNLIRKVSTNGIITAVAGNGTNGYSGDGGAATNVSLAQPEGVAVDTTGNLFIADADNQRVRKVDAHGLITTVAGSGNYGYSGDGDAATNASFAHPAGVAVDAFGNLFIADAGNNRIRKVNPAGIITTVAGNGTNGFYGDGGAAANASLSSPSGVAVDAADNLFIADSGNSRIRKMAPNGIITTVAGNGNYGYSGDGGAATNARLTSPSGVAVDATGKLYIADSNDGLIRSVNTNGIIITVAGNGNIGYSGDGDPATSASLSYPGGVAVAASGNLFIADTGNNRIREVAANGIINTIAGGYLGNGVAATQASLNNPQAVAVDTLGNLFIADSNDSLVREVSASGVITTLAGNGINGYSGDGGAATNASLNYPEGAAVDASGNLYIADLDNQRIRKVDTRGFITTVAGGGFDYPGDGGAATNANLNNPEAVAVDADGDLFIADTYNQRICEVGSDGILITVAGNGNSGYSGDGGAATNASLAYPAGVAVDAFGNLFIADTDNNVIRRVNPQGLITTVAGNGNYGYFGDGGSATNASLDSPEGVSVDASGNLLIADYGNSVIREVSANGIITTVAGDGGSGYSGDGGAATNASLSNPQDVTADQFGNLFIADSGNNRIREVTPGAPTLTLTLVGQNDAGNYDVVVTSPFGSVTSTVATLTVEVIPTLSIIAPGYSATGFVLSSSGLTGANYSIEASTNLVNWVPLSTNPAPFEFTDVHASNYPTRFYRMVLIP